MTQLDQKANAASLGELVAKVMTGLAERSRCAVGCYLERQQSDDDYQVTDPRNFFQTFQEVSENVASRAIYCLPITAG
jgi:hypothetical protein